MKYLDVFEHGRLLIDEETFTRKHWESFVKLNTIHHGEYFEVLHNGLKFKQFVGVLQVDGLIVHIHPKADKEDADVNWKGVLLQMLKKCGRVKIQATGNAQLRKQNVNLLEIYFEYYLHELEVLLHAGLIKKYRRETNNVKALKGSLEFSGNIRKNLVHKERFYTTHQVYDVNHKLHQVLSHALSIIEQFTKGSQLNDRCRRVRLAFPEVQQIKPTAQLLAKIQIDRKTAPYDRALELAKFIILNYSPDINHGQQKMIALLFDMNELWEEYVLKMLRKYAGEHPEENLHVSGQESKLFYGSYRTIRPDIVLRKNQEVYVLDTKWKKPTNQSPSIEDLRQMYAYGRYWNSDFMMLLYPGELYDGGYKSYENRQYDTNCNHQCKIGMVKVMKSDGSLDESIGKQIVELITN